MKGMEENHTADQQAAVQVKCSGRLYITDKNSCFNADKIRFAIPHKAVKSIAKVQGRHPLLCYSLTLAWSHMCMELISSSSPFRQSSP